MPMTPVADALADALESLACSLREGEIVVASFTVGQGKEFERTLSMTFDEVAAEDLDDDDEGSADVDGEPTKSERFVGMPTPTLLRAVSQCCPQCSSTQSRDVGRNGSGDDERLCVSCNHTWVPGRRAQGA